MKRILLFIYMLMAFAVVQAQQPSNYYKESIRREVLALKADSGFHIQAYNGVPYLRSGVWTGAGLLGVDSTNNRFYFYSGGNMIRVANYNEIGDTLVWRLGGNSFTTYSLDPRLGTTTNDELQLITNNTIRAVIPAGGIVRSNADSLRCLAYDTISKKFYYRDCGGGGTQDLASVTSYGATTTDTIGVPGLNLYDDANTAYFRTWVQDNVYYFKNVNGFAASFDFSSITGSRNIAVPDASGVMMLNPMTTTGDIVYSSDNTGLPARLGIGSSGQIMRVNSGIPQWFTPTYILPSDTASMLANYLITGYNGLTKSSKFLKLGGTLTENTTITYSDKYTLALDSVWRFRMYGSRLNTSDSVFMIYPTATSGGVPLVRVSSKDNYTYVNNLDVYAQANFGGATYIDASGVLRFVNSSGYVTFQGGSYLQSFQQTTTLQSDYLNVPSDNVGWRFNNTTNGVPSTADTANYANLGVGFTSPVSGLYRSIFKVTSVGVRITDGTQGAGKVFTSDANGNGSWQTPSGGGGGAISALTAATGTNTINNAAYLQEWQWNTLASTSGLKLSSTSTAAASNTQKLFEVSLSGTNSTSTQTTYTAYFVNGHAGTSSTNVTVFADASNGTTSNYPFWGQGGSTPKIVLKNTGGSGKTVTLAAGTALSIFQFSSGGNFGIQAASAPETDGGASGYLQIAYGATYNTIFGNNLAYNQADPSAQVGIITSASKVGFKVFGASSQTANLQEWLNNSATVLGYVDKDGAVNAIYKPLTSFTTSASSLTPNFTSYEGYGYTALAANLTINAPTGTPANGQTWWIYIKDDGTSRTLSWNAAFVEAGITLPASTTAGKAGRYGGYYANSVYYATSVEPQN